MILSVRNSLHCTPSSASIHCTHTLCSGVVDGQLTQRDPLKFLLEDELEASRFLETFETSPSFSILALSSLALSHNTQTNPIEMDVDLSPTYLLSTQLLSDGEPVRCLAPHRPSSSSSSTTHLLSGSQGGILTRFDLDDGSMDIQPGGSDTRHPHQITALLSSYSSSLLVDSFSSSSLLPSLYVTGCKDGKIRVMDGNTHQLKFTLEGHTNAVTSLSWVPPPPPRSVSTAAVGANTVPWLVSGSWDGTAKLWDVFSSSSSSPKCLGTLPGHENTVSVAGLPSADEPMVRNIVTVSAGRAEGNTIRGHTVRLWRLHEGKHGDGSTVPSSEVIAAISDDHSGPIRDVCYDAFTHSIYTCSNDGTVKLRSVEGGGACHTTLACPGGDRPMLLSLCVVGDDSERCVVAGAEDGNVVVWDISGRRDVQIIPHPGCVWKVVAFANGDFVTACHDGHVRIFTRHVGRAAHPDVVKSFEEAVTAAQSARSSGPSPDEIAKLPKWEMNALTQGRSEGQVQVFQKEGKAIAAQWSAASRTWIEVGEVTGSSANAGTINGKKYDHVLPIEIDVPGGGVQKLQIGYNNGENPFVTAQQFIDEHIIIWRKLRIISGRGRAGPTLGMGAPSSNGGYVTVPMEMSYDHLPMRGYKVFDAGVDKKGVSKVVQKIREFNQDVSCNQLSSDEVGDSLDSLTNTLCITNRYHSSTISTTELMPLRKMILKWDVSHAFPALDLARMTVLHPDAAKGERKAYWKEVLDGALSLCLGLGEAASREVAAPMLTMRLVCNCFKGGSGAASAAESLLDRILDCVEICVPSNNKNVRLAVATALLNTSSYMYSSSSSSVSSAIRILDLVGTIVGSGKYESEAVGRILVALGTVLLIPGKCGSDAKQAARERGIVSMMERVASGNGDAAIAVAKEIRSILS
ncbi:hypothetical protein HJC23_013349 [Cyclotella cryptica]|uniref:Phospholipase A-2-activating protein n=1 Tax=Cyclotella cryptica TaxID=29204 RepID=A0ABD3P6R2_9STRA